MASQTPAVFVYVGTYNRTQEGAPGDAPGIFVYRMDPATGNLTLAHSVGGVGNPSFLTFDPSQRHLYAVNESGGSDGEPGGGVSAFAVDQATGGLTFLNRQSSRGNGPCHLMTDRTGRYVLVANYGSGSVAMLPIQPDGSLAPASDFVQHAGSGPDPARQKGPHAHSANVDPGNRYALVADLGLDKIMVYRMDLDAGKLVPNDEPWAATHPGAGPRHLDFHPNGRFVYVANELDSTYDVFAYDGERGRLRHIQTVQAAPEGLAVRNYPSDIHFAPSGRFLYASNRGHDTIVVFAVDPETGKLTLVQYVSTQGEFPRNFGLDPTGSFLLAANQRTDNIVTYRIDQATGKLAPTGQVLELSKPVCVRIVHLAG